MSDAKVIITRAQPGADATALRVLELGLSPIISPALSLRLVHPVPAIPIEGCAGILFTSANGVRFFTRVSDVRNLIAWCVGPSTSAAAREVGFANVYDADGNSADLAKLVAQKSVPDDGHLVHIANTAAGNALQSELLRKGFDIRFVGLYEPTEITKLNDEAAQCVDAGKSFCVLIHSAKGAAAFAKLFAPFEGVQTTFICVSDKAAKPVSHLGAIRVADRPNEDALLQNLRHWQLAL